MPFYYTGCGGNDNNFVYLEHCQEQCPQKVGEYASLEHAWTKNHDKNGISAGRQEQNYKTHIAF
jgi:hypothetical protein